MIFKNAMSFKAKIKKISNISGVSTQQVQQNYLIEAFLSKLSKSKYKQNFIIKGGYLIGSIIGSDIRSTMDLDTSIKGIQLNHNQLFEIANSIIEIPTEESFNFSVDSIEEIRKVDNYPGMRLKLIATFERIKEVVIIDVTSGDVITPREVQFNFKKIFDDENLELLAYPLETILAEKVETILSRGIASTRPRDLYDVFILSKLKSDQIDQFKFRNALKNTMKKRDSKVLISDYETVLKVIRENAFQQSLWVKYQKQYSYANDITFDETIDSVMKLIKKAL